MQNYWLSFTTIAPLFLVILIGVIFSKTKSFKKEWITVLNDYALWIGFPALILSAMFKLSGPLATHLELAGWNSGYIICSMLFAFPIARIFKLKKRMLQTIILMISFGNVTYLGLPVLQNAYGDGIVPEVILLSAVYLFWLFTLGIILVEILGSKQLNLLRILKSLATNPLLITVFIGLFILILKIEVHPILKESINLVGNSVTAVVLFSLGLFLGSHPIGKVKEWLPALAFSMVILTILPFLFKTAIDISGSDFSYRISIMEAAMPLGLTPYVLAVKYNLESGFASKVLVLSTLMSVFTLPLWMIIIG